ncbi:MAG: AIR synthase-related protein, partial [Clostridium sp.]|nr:AIR synthase-related protein [Clostridium sp.]
SVVSPTVVVTVYGEKLWENRHKEVTANLDIVMTKWAGLYGGAILAKLRREELLSRYPESYIAAAADYLQHTSLMPELQILEENGELRECIYAAHDVSNGGIFGALWQLLSACGCGAEIPIEAIPVKQEIIEISEYFDLNPYLMNGQGSLLLVVRNGELFIEKMNGAGIEAVILGKTMDSAERKILLGDEERFLNPPKGDALNAVFYGQPLPV